MLLWPFNKYPGTDYETFNWEWILKTVKDWVQKMQTFLDSITAGWDAMQEDWQDFVDSTYKEQITEILEDHPEWTTTVMDGAITFQKLNGSIQAFTTPEAFGAVGDGVTDDTQAWQDAVDVGVSVIAMHDKYKCGTIEVTKNITIDANNAEFICTDDKLFYCHGEATGVILSAPNYVANKDYALNDDDYTGFAMLTSADNIITTRNYYYGGFAATFENGICHAKYPASFTGVTVQKYDPVTCEIKNIETVTHPNDINNNFTVHIEHGYKCKVSNIHQDGEKYGIVSCKESLQCEIEKISGYVNYNGTLPYYYCILLDGSSECVTHDCDLTSEWWHCWTTGGNYLCFYNSINNCSFSMGAGGTAVVDHDNAIGTKVSNSSVDGLSLQGNSIVTNVKIKQCKPSRNASVQACNIVLYCTNLDDCNNFTLENIDFFVDTSNPPTNAINFGIVIAFSAQTSNNDYIVNNVNMKNIYSNYYDGRFSLPYMAVGAAAGADSVTMKGVWVFDNVVGRVTVSDTSNMIDWASCEWVVRNCERRGSEGFRLCDNNTFTRPMKITVYDSVLGHINGIYTDLTLRNVEHFEPGQQFIATGTKLVASDCTKIADSTLLGFTNALVTNMIFNINYMWAYAIHNQYMSVYGRIEGTGIVNYTLQ